MFKRFLMTALLLVAFAFPVQAADNGVYVGLKFIDSINTNKTTGDAADIMESYTNNTFGGGIFVGYDFYPQHKFPLRAEIEYALRSNSTYEESSVLDFDRNGTTEYGSADYTFNVQTLMANLYLDFHNSTAFTPYIGAGLGVAFINNKLDVSYNDGTNYYGTSVDQLNTVFAWNVGVGCAYAFNDNLSMDLAYRFVGLGDNRIERWGMEYSSSPYLNEFSLALRYTF